MRFWPKRRKRQTDIEMMNDKLDALLFQKSFEFDIGTELVEGGTQMTVLHCNCGRIHHILTEPVVITIDGC